MAFRAGAQEILGGVGHDRKMVLTFSDMLCQPEILLRTLVDKIAEEYLRNHYTEIEKEIDPKVIAAMVSQDMGARVEERLRQEIARVSSVASTAKREAKRR